jgi:predicted phosphodiesterase
VRLFEVGGLRVGALFDGVKHGLFVASEPLAVSADFDGAMDRVFGCKLDVLLCASTHQGCIASASGVLIVNPGSPTLSDRPAVAVLHVADRLARVEPMQI